MYYLRLEVLIPSYQLRRAQLQHEVDSSKTYQFINTCSSISSSHAKAIDMLWPELIDYCSLRLANQSLTGKTYIHTLQQGTADCVVPVYFSSNILNGLWYCCSLCRRLWRSGVRKFENSNFYISGKMKQWSPDFILVFLF